MKYAYLLLAGLAASGCANNDLSLTITRFAAITSQTMCVADATSMNGQTAGLLDVGIVKAGAASGIEGYVAAPVVTNNLPERAGAGQIELDSITVDAFQISLTLDSTLSGAVPLGQRVFTQNAAVGTIPPGGASMFAAPVEILPAQIATEMASAVQPGATFLPTVIASVQPLGWHGGSRVAGRAFAFPVKICNLCLTTNPIPTCPGTPVMSSLVTEGGCFAQQDASISCCTSNGQLLCGHAFPQTTM